MCGVKLVFYFSGDTAYISLDVVIASLLGGPASGQSDGPRDWIPIVKHLHTRINFFFSMIFCVFIILRGYIIKTLEMTFPFASSAVDATHWMKALKSSVRIPAYPQLYD